MKTMRRYLYFLIILFTFILGFYFYLAYSNLSGSVFIYPLDDAYIHLSLARNFAENGVWGVNPGSFDSASSSILYTLVLSVLIKLFGDSIYYPLIVNVVAGYATVYYTYKYFRDFYGKNEVLWGLILLIPYCQLCYMVLIGMEQTLHILLTVMMLYYLVKNLRSGFANYDCIKLFFVSILFGAVRFESMFFISILAFLLLLRKNWKEGLMVFFAGFLPIIIFGIFSVRSGGYFFPNSLLMKGNYPESNFLVSVWNIFKNGILLNVSFYKLFLAPFLILFFYFLSKYKTFEWRKLINDEIVAITVLGTIVLHSLFAVIRYRYESYLMAALVLIIIPVVVAFFKQKQVNGKFSLYKKLILGSFSVVLLYSIYISIFNYKVVKYASKNIEEQQIEMARFLYRFYPNQKIVANDIGAISYFSNVEIFDIAGLASTNVAGFYLENKHLDIKVFEKKYHDYMSGIIRKNKFRVAVIYPAWFPDGVPSDWIPVVSWTIKKKMGVADQTVVWYAVNEKEANILWQNLKKFDLNNNVEKHYYK